MGRDDVDVMVVGAGVSGYVAPVLDMPSYLAYLRGRAEAAGAGIEIRRVGSLDGVLTTVYYASVVALLLGPMLHIALTRAANGRYYTPAAEPVGETGSVS